MASPLFEITPEAYAQASSDYYINHAELDRMLAQSIRCTSPYGTRRNYDYFFDMDDNVCRGVKLMPGYVPAKTVRKTYPQKEVVAQPSDSVYNVPCEFCQGTGKVTVYDECPKCEGAGCYACENGLLKGTIPCQECCK